MSNRYAELEKRLNELQAEQKQLAEKYEFNKTLIFAVEDEYERLHMAGIPDDRDEEP